MTKGYFFVNSHTKRHLNKFNIKIPFCSRIKETGLAQSTESEEGKNVANITERQ